MDKCSQPTAIQKAVWTYLLKTTPSVVSTRPVWIKDQAKSSRIKLIPLFILISWGSVVEEQTVVVSDFTPAHLSYLKQEEQDHLGRTQITKECLWIDIITQKPLLFPEKDVFYWPMSFFVAAEKNHTQIKDSAEGSASFFKGRLLKESSRETW